MAQIPAEVRTDSMIGSETGRASVAYNSSGGVTATQGDSGYGYGGYDYGPDGLPGHQFFSQDLYIFPSNVRTLGTADLTHGLVRAYGVIDTAASNIGTAIASTKMQLLDTLTFSNSTGQPATITVNWKVEGSLSSTAGSIGSRANYQTELRLDGPGLSAIFGGSATVDNNRAHSVASTSATGWQTSSVQPFSQGYGGAAFSGTLTVPPGGLTLALSAYLLADSGGDHPAVANFSDNGGGLTISLPQGVSFTSTDGTLGAGSRMVNISTRADVLGGESVPIAGFIVAGTVPKKVIIRGRGPSIPVNGALPDPTLELHHPDTSGNDVIIAHNDNWNETQQSEIEATGIPPTNDLDSAIVRTLDPGFYTAILRGKGSATGIGIIEVFDLEASADSKLTNISTRAFVESNNNVLIAGLIGGGNGSDPQILIRAIGPSLSNFGVSNALQDPILELHDVNGALLVSNDDWQSDQKDAIQATELAPTNPKESAILTTILPTNYTAVVNGKNGGTGVGLVEIYHLR